MPSDQYINLQNSDSLCVKTFDGRDVCQSGWQNVENRMTQLWTDLPQVSNVCRELVKSGCKKDAQDDVNI